MNDPSMDGNGSIFKDVVGWRILGSELSNDCNVKKVSVDSGIETGNDSNDSAITQNDNNPQNSTISKSNRRERLATSSILSLTPVIKDIDPSTKKVRCMIEEIDQPGSSLSADASDTACNAEYSLRLSTNMAGPLILYNKNSMPHQMWKFHQDSAEVLPRFHNLSPQAIERGIRRRANRIIPYNPKLPGTKSTLKDVFRQRHFKRMYIAATTNNVALMKMLLDIDESPNCCVELEQTPLHIACSRGYTEIVRLLLEYGADPMVRNSMGNTSLHVAINACDVSVVTLLLSAGADPFSTNDYGQNHLQIAEEKLRLLKLSRGHDMERIKTKAEEIVNVILACMENRRHYVEQVEALGNFCSRLSLSSTTHQVQDEARDLLLNIDTLNLKS